MSEQEKKPPLKIERISSEKSWHDYAAPDADAEWLEEFAQLVSKRQIHGPLCDEITDRLRAIAQRLPVKKEGE